MRQLVAFVLLCATAAPAWAGQTLPSSGTNAAAQVAQVLRVFFDCAQNCDFTNIRQEVTFVNYVSDRKDADVHVLVTTQGTASGGREYTFEFIGLEKFADLGHRAIYASSGSDTDDERRRGVNRTFSLGLTPFLLRTASAPQFSLRYAPGSTHAAPATAADDPWNFWIFRVGASAELSGEERQESRRVRSNISANRTTDQWKFSFNGYADFNTGEFTMSDGRKVDSSTESWNVSGTVIKTIGADHWGGLLRADVRSSTQSNERYDSGLSTGLEYDFFSYAESTRRTFVVQASIGIGQVDYYETTLYGKNEETLGDYRIATVLALRQPWGTWRASAAYRAYVHDADLYNIDLFADADVRLFRGFTLNVDGSFSRVRDQLYLPRDAATDEEVLLRLRRLETGYRYRVTVGFSYQFGSIYNNVVNPRWSATTGRGPGGG